ncbi:MAG: glycerophosphodiester phosphodiesterase [Bdellovibrionales bacterium]
MGWINTLHALVEPPIDLFYKVLPSKRPTQYQIQRTQIIAHRGDHLNYTENSLQALDSCVKHGIFGVEIDIQWTKDLVPIIFHDPSTKRVFPQNADVYLKDLNYSEISLLFPSIPTLDEVVAKFANRLHLMFEIKPQDWMDDSQKQTAKSILQEKLSPMTVGKNFHFLFFREAECSLLIPEFIQHSFLIAELNMYAQLNRVVERDMKGLCCHYALVTPKLRKQVYLQKKQLGVGYPGSKNAYYRECRLGTDFVFTNDALQLQSIKNETLKQL